MCRPADCSNHRAFWEVMAPCSGPYKLEIWTLSYQYPDVGRYTWESLYPAVLGLARQGGKFQCSRTHRPDGTTERNLPGSTDYIAERGPRVHWREMDELAGKRMWRGHELNDWRSNTVISIQLPFGAGRRVTKLIKFVHVFKKTLNRLNVKEGNILYVKGTV
mgnify:CR=1 FL=1